jgi:tetratricopeptide (TPR) repeat protein
MNTPNPTTETDYLRLVQEQLRTKQFNNALRVCDEWLETLPNHPEAQYFRAVSLRSLGLLDEAVLTLTQLLETHPQHDRGLQERAHCARQQGDMTTALRYYHRATSANKALLSAWFAQRDLLNQTGQSGVDIASDQIAYLQALPQPLRIALDLQARGKLAKAETVCKRFLQQNPRHGEGMRILAEIATQLGALDEAEQLLAGAEHAEPHAIAIKMDIVRLARKQQKFQDAYEQARLLADRTAGNRQTQSLAAVEAMQIGRYTEALERFEALLREVPDDPLTLTARGHALKTLGQTTKAIDSYQQALRCHAGYGEAWHALANLKTYQFSDSERETMIRLLKEDHLDNANRIFVDFALAKAWEDEGDYAQAFRHYAEGNYLKKTSSRYDAQRMSDDLAAQARVCTPALFNALKEAGTTAPDPIFIVGLPRAGSTLLEQILSSHSEVDGTLELPNVLSRVQRLRREGQGYPDNLAEISPESYREWGEAYLEDTRIHRQGAPFFIDKMPNNFRHIGLIKLMLPNAKIIDARRNPMDCCFSGFKQLFAEGQEFSYDLGDIGRYYRDYVDLMDHWAEVFPDQILTVHNEDVIRDLESEVRRMLEFCNLPFESSCLQYWETQRAVKTPSSEQVRRPVSTVGQHQWRRFEPWLAPLKTALGDELVALSAF